MEPVIGHWKSDGHLGRNGLQGMVGDWMNVLRCGAGHHRRRILRPRRFFGHWILGLGGGICDVLRGPERPGTAARWNIPGSEVGQCPTAAACGLLKQTFQGRPIIPLAPPFSLDVLPRQRTGDWSGDWPDACRPCGPQRDADIRSAPLRWSLQPVSVSATKQPKPAWPPLPRPPPGSDRQDGRIGHREDGAWISHCL